jgi:hypothetical protein
MAVVALLVMVLVGRIEIVEARGLLLVVVVADVRVVVAGRGAAVAGVRRGVLDETVVLPAETRARSEDRREAAGEIHVPRRRVRVRPHLYVVGAANPVGRGVAVLDDAGELAEDVAAAADVVGELRPPVRSSDRDGQRQPLRGEPIGPVQVVVRVGGVAVA